MLSKYHHRCGSPACLRENTLSRFSEINRTDPSPFFGFPNKPFFLSLLYKPQEVEVSLKKRAKKKENKLKTPFSKKQDCNEFSKSRLKNYEFDRPGKFREKICIQNVSEFTQVEIFLTMQLLGPFLAVFLVSQLDITAWYLLFSYYLLKIHLCWDFLPVIICL